MALYEISEHKKIELLEDWSQGLKFILLEMFREKTII